MLRSERGQIQASDAGSLVSGHRRWENDGVTQSLSKTTGAPSIAAGARAGVPRRGGILRPGLNGLKMVISGVQAHSL